MMSTSKGLPLNFNSKTLTLLNILSWISFQNTDLSFQTHIRYLYLCSIANVLNYTILKSPLKMKSAGKKDTGMTCLFFIVLHKDEVENDHIYIFILH